MGNSIYTKSHGFLTMRTPQFHLLFIPKIDVYLTGRCLAYVLSGCKSRVDDDASGFNRSMVRMFVNGVASDMLLRPPPPPLPPPFPLSVPIRAKSIFELTYGNSFGMGKFIWNYYFLNSNIFMSSKTHVIVKNSCNLRDSWGLSRFRFWQPKPVKVPCPEIYIFLNK